MGHRSDLDHDRRGQASIFVTVDHASTECLGIHAARRATRFEALEPLRQGVRSCFGAFAAGIAGGLSLRRRPWHQFVADDYQRELAFLGIASSAGLRARARGQRLRRAVHPDLEGEPVARSIASTASRTSAWPCTGSRRPTTGPGSSSATATRPQRPSERRSSRRSRRRHEPATRCLTNCGPLHRRWRKPACLTKPVSLNRAIRTSPTIVRCQPFGQVPILEEDG